MRRPGPYGNSGGNAYVSGQMQHVPSMRMEQRSGRYQGRQVPLTSEKEPPYGTSKTDEPWRWERDGSKVPNAMTPHMFNEGQGGDASRSFYHGQSADPRMTLEKQGNNDTRSQAREEIMKISFEDNLLSQSLESLEQRFLDEILKLSKEQTDAEDAENARHRERINSINVQYEDQLGALRARHANRRDEFLRRESQARQEQYHQAATEPFPNSGMGTSDTHRYGAIATPPGEPHRAYSAEYNDTYGERARFFGGSRDHGFEARGQYTKGRVYDTGSRYY